MVDFSKDYDDKKSVAISWFSGTGGTMQINSDYSGRQSHSYGQSHTHHITECMHDEGVKKQKENTGSTLKSSYQKGDAAKAAVEYIASFSVEEVRPQKKSAGVGTFKGFWDSLGEDGNGQETFDIRKSVMNGVHGAAAAIQTFFSEKVVNRVAVIKEKAKALPAAATRKLGEGKEAFGALMSGNMSFGQKNPRSKEKNKKEEILAAKPVNEHLMDSYNKTGRYCQIQENLTYQKPKTQRSTEQKD
ncbi:MAG: hypothetical protein IJO65_08525 [Lachnospiraceae bacterium]|nr:hypothetical protein [Lachnospiraceae bacterium]